MRFTGRTWFTAAESGTTGIWTGFVLCGASLLLSWFMLSVMGVAGLLYMVAGLVSLFVTMFLMVRYPIAIAMCWFLAMSGLQTLIMIRMPGLPDFSFSRLFLIMVLILLPLGAFLGKPLIRPPYLPDLLIVTYTCYVFLNFFIIGDPTRFNTWFVSSFAPMVGYFFAKQYVKSDRDLRLFLWSIILVTTYFWLVSIGDRFQIEAIVWPKHILDRNIGNSWFGRSRGPFLQPALFGQILGMYLLVHLFVLTRRLPVGLTLAVALNLGLGAWGLLYTYTRGGWLATGIGLAFMATVRPRFRKYVLVAALVFIVVSTVGVLNPAGDEFLGERMGDQNTIESRLGFLATATRMIANNPLFGVGFFRYVEFRHLYNQGTDVPFYGYIRREAGARTTIHDIYIGRAAEEGLVGLFLFFSFYLSVVPHYVRRWRENLDRGWFDRDALAMFGGVIIAFFVGGAVIDYRYFDLVNVIPAFLAGVIVGFPRRACDAPTQPSPGGR